ncbi:uncharacterized protein DUF3179 [Ilumatobacter fluminis]|uniref:Uncharacterized protein DUF3179 n=1 Tax=Ilumatobacter fluminis TaxID=467091 RepID=A0A4V3EIT5_9ACTN|nr:DUF3179 domain-containing protein [Ilumatobacter fluminis]TDT15648.1 uncharacterized protein DUF3179 [Ilumatobacter fluminis]
MGPHPTATRRSAALVAAALFLAACGSSDDPGSTDGSSSDSDDPSGSTVTSNDTTHDTTDDPPRSTDPVVIDRIEPSPPDVQESGLDLLRLDRQPDDSALPDPIVPLAEITSGGPPPDGIPSIDDPQFARPDSIDFLDDDEPVLSLDIDGDVRAYPVQILIWHEIVNDTVGGIPVSVTYCPLCNSAVAYDRRVGDRILEFGTSGSLWNSALVMYDRQTESLWSHFTGQAIAGELTGTELVDFPLTTIGWAEWREQHPDGIVLTRDTGRERDYGRNPYPGYDDIDGTPFLFEGEVDGRFTAMTRIVGVERDGVALGIQLALLEDERLVATEFDDDDIVAFWTPGTASALDANTVSGGADVGTTGVFEREVDGVVLDFRAEGDGFVDEQTGSTWNVFGRATDGELTGTQLEQLPHVDTFWFAWSTFRPDSSIVS